MAIKLTPLKILNYSENIGLASLVKCILSADKTLIEQKSHFSKNSFNTEFRDSTIAAPPTIVLTFHKLSDGSFMKVIYKIWQKYIHGDVLIQN